MDILSLLKSLDKQTLEKGISQAKDFLATPSGQELAKKLSQGNFTDTNLLPPELQNAANALANDKAAQKALGDILNKNG